MLVPYDFKSLYSSAQIDLNITWPQRERNYPFKKQKIEMYCSLFNSGRWNELNKSAFLTVRYQDPENLVFQQIPVKKLITHKETVD